jgi:GH24 family phage-related lysozyme (muramidase)
MNAGTPSSACLALVKRFEGYRADALAFGGDRWLVGYGHVRVGQPPHAIGEPEAEFLLKEDLEEIAQVLRGFALTQPQFDALSSFGFSIGAEALASSDVLALARAGDVLGAAEAMDRWTASGAGPGPDEQLVRRRAVEKALFLTDDVANPAPSALLRPHRIDDDHDKTETEGPRHRPKSERTDVVGLAALGVLGLLLIAMGVTGADEDHGMAYFVFAGPGLVGVAMSVYYLLKKTVDAV